jgi:hypothetical protein
MLTSNGSSWFEKQLGPRNSAVIAEPILIGQSNKEYGESQQKE